MERKELRTPKWFTMTLLYSFASSSVIIGDSFSHSGTARLRTPRFAFPTDSLIVCVLVFARLRFLASLTLLERALKFLDLEKCLSLEFLDLFEVRGSQCMDLKFVSTLLKAVLAFIRKSFQR